MNTPSPQNHLTNQETVSWLAYQLWEYAGRPEGRATEFWPHAESLVALAPPRVGPYAPGSDNHHREAWRSSGQR